MKYKFRFKYTANGASKTSSSINNADFDVAIKENGQVLSLTVNPKTPIEFENFEMIIDRKVKSDERIFTNGFQSWTTTKEYSPDGKMDEYNPKIGFFQKKYFNFLGMFCSGDMLFHKYPEKSGIFYGWSYAYVRKNSNIVLFGSLSERAGYTIITFDTNEDTISIQKDLEGVTFTEPKEVLSLAVINDEYDAAFDKYFELMEIAKPKVTRKCGYTTWYNYYTGITEEVVRRDLNSISQLNTKVDIFQIDDGYQRTVGDWLVLKEKDFPTGMKAVADEIHSHDMLAGLWLAPFGATPKSYIYKEHKDWFVHDKKGKIRFAGHNWGGFYALDIYNEGARDYIRKVFDVVLNEWGYDMVKLDFLYACSIIPIHGKSRGEIMCDGMDFLRECCGDKIILGCGVPLAPSFGKVDFCRIGADMSLSWNNKPATREDVSTVHTLTNSIFRRHLDGRAFLNDPDVFLLRENNISLPMEQRKIIAKINSLFGNLLFVSDDVATYTPEQKQVFLDTVTKDKADIISAEYISDNVIKTVFVQDGKEQTYTVDMKNGTATLA